MRVIDKMITESRPVKWIMDEYKKGNLFVDDSFQRNYVWMNKDRISLIETMLLGYPIPEIYLWETDTDPSTGETRYSIIDGQQRIRTIGLFIDNDLKLTDAGLEFHNHGYRGKQFSELSSKLKSDAWSYNVSVRFVKKEVEREEIVKMFLRLNRTSNALNPQELRKAEFNGEFLSASVEVADMDFWREWNLFTEMDIRRMQDIQFASTLLIYARSGFEDETTQSSINRMYDLYNDSYPQRSKDVRSAELTLGYLDKVLRTQGTEELAEVMRKKTHAYTIFVAADALRKYKIPAAKFAEKVSQWYRWNELGGAPKKMTPLVAEFKRLSQEGVQKRANRFRRFEILHNYVVSEDVG
ncbi:DUF262 domain-containing protein [Stenotrophomonas muris]|uniref:DUF262 domain-containing protein n=1 Tax=Stenotrophomonas muris TaxID=2963283 RepID=UPI002E768EAB|nr:DUF262 domain-containing protein [Stenotrophomonas muris]